MKMILLLILTMFSCMETYLVRVRMGRRRPKYRAYAPVNPIVYDLNTDDPAIINQIVDTHNFFRSSVNPPASNMLELNWNYEAANSAREWANQCQFLTHHSDDNSYVNNYGNCGQNIFVSTHPFSWKFVIKAWFSEHVNFTYGGYYNDVHAVGHYTQMVWATTHQIGCHYRWCPFGSPNGRPYHTYICDYCPTGNWAHKLSTPYKYGMPCSQCEDSCDMYGKLCTNGCPHINDWRGCERLSKLGLCNTIQHGCKATCNCQDQIYELQ